MFALLAGAALSFGAARHHGGCHQHQDRRAALEARVARVCVDAAREAEAGAAVAPEEAPEAPSENGPPGYSPSR